MPNTSRVTSKKVSQSAQIMFKKPKYPPEITPAEIARKRINNMRDPKRINSRGPNCFMIYRMYCTSINTVSRGKRNRIQMTKLSAMIAESWENESLKVKGHYRHLAEMTEVELKKHRRSNEIHVLQCKL
ncbi:14616_t:CDS:1 [Acaulospora morrowiae]|uniref:14616_t:CDS:1 n=1 Tax=Acaulospora morrowiae TaxID=94023 RepID=A0A9N9AR32_9GLOM|nr:14616_t:CDS:1 [Acaulospora morrowiae]